MDFMSLLQQHYVTTNLYCFEECSNDLDFAVELADFVQVL